MKMGLKNNILADKTKLTLCLRFARQVCLKVWKITDNETEFYKENYEHNLVDIKMSCNCKWI